MADDRIDGPTPFRIRAIPGGAQLELERLRAQIVGDVLDALLDPADTSLWDRLHELADPPEGTAVNDLRLPYEELVAALAERSSYRVPLYGREQLLEVSRRLREIAFPKPVPAQRRSAS